MFPKKYFAAAAVSGMLIFNAAAAPVFEIDANTLLLSSFENSLTEPDYAVGPGDFMGGGVRFAPGYSGRGIDLRAVPIQKADFTDNPPANMAGLNRWTLQMPGNFLPDEGTMEFFIYFEPRPPKKITGMCGGNLFVAINSRFLDLGDHYVGASLRWTRSGMSWQLPLWGKDTKGKWEDKIKFPPRSFKSGWHHFALTWGKGEAVIYVDGRAAASCDLSGYYGLNLMNNVMHGFGFANFVLDELRISDIVRYTGDFEPPWLGGKRPANAWKGPETPVKRYKYTPRKLAVPEKTWENSFEFNDLSCAIFLREGLNRRKLAAKNFRADKNGLQGRYGTVDVTGKFADAGENSRKIMLEFLNTGTREAKVEFQFGAAPKFTAGSYFDGLQERFIIKYPRFRDSYPLVMPLAAAADKKQFAAIALDPHFPYNDLIHAWRGNRMFCGTKFVLAPGEKFALTVYTANGKSKYGTAAALDKFYNDYADLYMPKPGSTVYTGLPLANHYGFNPAQDIQRQGFGGGYWGHGPYHTAADDTGFYWDEKLDPADKSAQHALSWRKRINGSREDLLNYIRIANQHEYDNGYGVRFYHGEPDLIAKWLVNKLDPSFKPVDDPMHTGQYYAYRRGKYIFNELNTPMGDHLLKVTEDYFNAGMKGFSPAWINDVFYINTVCRFNDPVAQRTAGRSFSEDMGVFVRGAAGKLRRIKFVNNLVSGKYRTEFIADGGSFSYAVAAHVVQSAIESGSIFDILSGMSFARYSRNLHGEKPVSAYNQPTQFDSGRYFDTKLATPELVREVYRYNQRQIILFSLKHAIQLAPASYSLGKQFMAERLPLSVMAVQLGRKAVPGGRVNPALWLRRSGESVNSLVAVGNETPQTAVSGLSLDKEVFGGVPVTVPFFGGKSTGNERCVDLKVPGFSVEALLTPLIINTDGKVKYTASMTGNGINFTIKAEIECEKPGTLKFADFAPLYNLKNPPSGKIPAGRTTLVLEYECPTLAFSAADWEKVELFRDGSTNFAIVAPKSTYADKEGMKLALGFDAGTAGLLADAVKLYDWENGILGDMAMPQWETEIDNITGNVWKVVLNTQAGTTNVTIDSNRKIISINGRSSGEARKAMVVFMRMVDRKYPRIGTFMPLVSHAGKFDLNNPFPPDKIRGNIKSKQFYKQEKFRKMLMQPLLNEEYEYLYRNDNNDFTGKYKMLTMPFIYEPTFSDGFVYGYPHAASQDR